MEPTSPETIENKPIIVPKEASQLFGAYLRQEFEGPLEKIGEPRNQRLVNFIDNLETSKVVKLVPKNGSLDFDFSKEKDKATLVVNNFIMSKNITPLFLSAIDHNVRNALSALVRFDDKMPFEMAGILTLLSNATELNMSRDENGKIKIIPIFQTARVT